MNVCTTDHLRGCLRDVARWCVVFKILFGNRVGVDLTKSITGPLLIHLLPVREQVNNICMVVSPFVLYAGWTVHWLFTLTPIEHAVSKWRKWITNDLFVVQPHCYHVK